MAGQRHSLLQQLHSAQQMPDVANCSLTQTSTKHQQHDQNMHHQVTNSRKDNAVQSAASLPWNKATCPGADFLMQANGSQRGVQARHAQSQDLLVVCRCI